MELLAARDRHQRGSSGVALPLLLPPMIRHVHVDIALCLLIMLLLLIQGKHCCMFST
jgi:hypothetical protein